MDTGQPSLAPENVALQEATNAFKAVIDPISTKPREDNGRFARAEGAEPEATPEIDAQDEPEALEADGEEQSAESDAEDYGDSDEAAEEAQPEATPLPASWSKDDEGLWNSLSPAAQAKILVREGQRDAAVNSKFQEAANVRKQAEAIAAEAHANRDAYAQALEQAMGLVQPQKPHRALLDPSSEYYDPDTYHAMMADFETKSEMLQVMQQQRQILAVQQQQAEAQMFAEVENAYRPYLMQSVPELTDPQKAPQLIHDIGQFAVEHGFSADQLQNATSREVHILWKAMQYDRLNAAKATVSAKPAPKPAGPSVKPGVKTPNMAVKSARKAQAFERLAKSGSVEDGAAIFKQMFK